MGILGFKCLNFTCVQFLSKYHICIVMAKVERGKDKKNKQIQRQ